MIRKRVYIIHSSHLINISIIDISKRNYNIQNAIISLFITEFILFKILLLLLLLVLDFTLFKGFCFINIRNRIHAI